MVGSPFTWSNYRDKASWARLDCFLLSLEILLWYPNLLQYGLSRSLSDHNVILIGEKDVEWGPKPFRFFNGWLEDKELMKEAIRGWNGCKVEGSKGWSLATKTKGAKNNMRKWLSGNKKSENKGRIIENRLETVEVLAESEGWNERLRKQRLELLSKLWKELRKEEQLWRQKSRVGWLVEGRRQKLRNSFILW
ncbi:hypothetical protein Dsin_000386 [Dipteronia sinensis]|uniref:Reverse transcriptase n=1 Tax=Dipteronia sinensis TaxID=43782 RepID=A0AAE0EJC5_9ROSI|nr:hypothetical protein Dsin_000386 [Dipteronia sinensis]